MRSDPTKYERLAVEEDARRASLEECGGRSVDDLPEEELGPDNGVMYARETAVIASSPAAIDRYRMLTERILNKVVHVLFTLDDQKSEIARLRENTRQILARLGTA